MNLPHRDELHLQRWLDGELSPPEAAAFEARVAAEPLLRRRAEAARGLRHAFAGARAAVMRPSATFTTDLLAAARRLPSRDQLQQADLAASAVAFCRRLLLAAAVLAVAGFSWHAGCSEHAGPETLQASPDEVLREMQRIDAGIERGK